MSQLNNALIGKIVESVVNQVLSDDNKSTTSNKESNFDLASMVSALSGGKLTETADKILADNGIDSAAIRKAQESNDSDLITSLLNNIDPKKISDVASQVIGAISK